MRIQRKTIATNTKSGNNIRPNLLTLLLGVRTMHRIPFSRLAITIAFICVSNTAYGDCIFAEQCDPNSCPAQNYCSTDSDCEVGVSCVPFGVDPFPGCAPSYCECNLGSWTCTDDCAPQCFGEPSVPTASPAATTFLLVVLFGIGVYYCSRAKQLWIR